MNRIKTYRFKLMPTKAQENAFVCWLGTTRYIYNLCLEYKMRLYADCGISISKNDIQKELTALKNDVPWMKELNAQTIQAVVDRLFLAYDAFFRRVKNGETPGFPKFTNKNRHKSFRFKQDVKLLSKESKLFLPKIGHVRFHKSQAIEGTIKTASIKKESSGWYVYLACEVDIAPLPLVEGTIGIDLGLKHAVVTSDGEVFDGPKALQERERQLKKAQQRLSRTEKRSNNRKKAIVEVSRIYEVIRNTRKDFLHKTSSALVRENQTIIAEALQVKNLVRRCKPKQDENGKFVPNGQAAKSGLNKSFSDAGLGALLDMLEYKAAWAGRTFIRVPAAYTSMDCSACGWRNHELTLADREWTCGGCGVLHDRDGNAARNILARGLKEINKGAGAPLLHLETRTETFEPVGAEAEGPNHAEQ